MITHEQRTKIEQQTGSVPCDLCGKPIAVGNHRTICLDCMTETDKLEMQYGLDYAEVLG